ncbi:MAG: SRPBCC family protein [Jatrophihabitantaceae bacterium]
MGDSVTVHMNASPDSAWSLVSDITNTGRWSPETIDAQWLDGASAPAVGVRFRGQVKRNGRGPTYWTTCKITACQPGREFAFAVIMKGAALNVWRYQFSPAGEGVDVTESFELSPTLPLRLYWAVLGWTRNKTNVNGMRQTLERVKSAAETA